MPEKKEKGSSKDSMLHHICAETKNEKNEQKECEKSGDGVAVIRD